MKCSLFSVCYKVAMACFYFHYEVTWTIVLPLKKWKAMSKQGSHLPGVKDLNPWEQGSDQKYVALGDSVQASNCIHYLPKTGGPEGHLRNERHLPDKGVPPRWGVATLPRILPLAVLGCGVATVIICPQEPHAAKHTWTYKRPKTFNYNATKMSPVQCCPIYSFLEKQLKSAKC